MSAHANPAARSTLALLAGIALAVGVAGCNKAPPDQSAASKAEQQAAASNKAELESTTPKIGPPPAQPAPVMPPKADTVFDQPGGQSAAAPGAPTASGNDAQAKQPMSKEQESQSMPMPAQANDHSTTATDSKNDTSSKETDTKR